MTISLSDATQKLLEEELRRGGYRSADEVVNAALGALKELQSHSLDDDALDAIDRAEEQIERGEVHDWADVRERVRAKFLGQ